MTEQQLITGLEQNDKQVFLWLRKKYGAKVVGYVMKNKGSQQEGEQVLHDAMVKIWQNVSAGKYKENGKFDSYFITIAANTWLSELRRRKRKPTTNITSDLYYLADKGPDELKIKFAREAQILALHKKIQELGELCRDLITKFHLQGITLIDLAAEKGINYKSMPKKMYDCRKYLKRKLEEGMS